MKTHCTKCGRALTDPFSIAVGMGPECRGGLSRKGWKFPKPKYAVRSGRVVFLGMVGKVEPPSAKDEGGMRKDEKKELVRRTLRNGGRTAVEDAVIALRDYMVEKDSPMTLRWCKRFVQRVIDEMNQEAEA